MKYWAIFFLLLLSFSMVEAGAGWFLPTTNERTFFFEPGAQYEGIWTAHRAESLIVTEGGSLAEYGSFFDPDPEGGERKISWELNLPNELAPGKHDYILYARENVQRGGAVGGIAQAAGTIWIISLYKDPHVFLEMTKARDISEGSRGEAILKFTSWTEQKVTVYADIQIFDSNNSVMGTTQTRSISLDPQEIVEEEVSLPTADYPPGKYLVKATLRGAQEDTTAQRVFQIGEFTLDLVDYSEKIYVDKINPFFITLKSNWNGETNGIYATVNLLNQSESTPITTIHKFGNGELKTFIDANNVQPHLAEGTIDVFLEKEYHNTFPITVNVTYASEETPGFIFELNALTGLYLLLLLLVLINIILLFRRKHEKE